MMDLRSYRDAETTAANYANPERTMLGSEQYEIGRASRRERV